MSLAASIMNQGYTYNVQRRNKEISQPRQQEGAQPEPVGIVLGCHLPVPTVKTAGAGSDFTPVSVLTRRDYDIDFS